MLDVEATERIKKMRKFKESAWKCIYYLSAEIFALSVTFNEAWFTNTIYFWVGPGNQVLYMFGAGFYTYSIFALIFWETRRSDFGVSMSHHVATLTLIVLSYIFRFARIGSVVLAIHDASDVFLEVGKMSKYSGAERIASFAFVMFVLSWILLRLMYYPFWVLWSTRFSRSSGLGIIRFRESNMPSGIQIPGNVMLRNLNARECNYEVTLTLDKEKHPVDGPIYYYVFNTLLFSLLVLHIYWWVLMYRMLVKQIQARGQISDDVRSDTESEDEHED
uniref:TLC domain-containing protein n=1 Tax=Fagus sylvatica TaxID=28930 RepID=A0A2N9GSQ9_FAGSY